MNARNVGLVSSEDRKKCSNSIIKGISQPLTHLAETALAEHVEEIEVGKADDILVTDTLGADTSDTVLESVVCRRPLITAQHQSH